MTQYGWPNCPPAVRVQIEQFIHGIRGCLPEQLLGIYLHGSLAMGCFNPDRSDLDILVITTRRIPVEIKRTAIELLLRLSERPAPIEISFLPRADMVPWRYPTPYDLHYSETWRADYERDLASDAWLAWNDRERTDPDLAAHMTITNHRGVCLYGAAIGDAFPAVPPRDYLAALAYDISDALGYITANPVYTVLNVCRTYAYVREGQIYSKDEGGRWALGIVPAQFHDVIATALTLYRTNAADHLFDLETLSAFATYIRNELAQVLSPRN